MKSRIITFLPALGWFLLSFYLLTLPGKAFPKMGWFDKLQGDKIVHIGMFAILVLLILSPFKQQWREHSFLRTAIIIAIAATLYGVVMEYVQKNFIPNRTFSIGDVVADTVGSFIPVGLVYRYLKQKAYK